MIKQRKTRMYLNMGCWMFGFGCPFAGLWMMSVGPLRIELGNLMRTPEPER